MAVTSYDQALARLFTDGEAEILADWVSTLNLKDTRMTPQEAESQGRAFLHALGKAVSQGNAMDLRGAEYIDVREVLQSFSRSRALQGFSPTETATFIFSLKRSVFVQVRKTAKGDGAYDLLWNVTQLIDQLGLFTVETYQKTREELIARQGKEIEELSTPVVKLWDGIVALPLIGTLDSGRTQVVMQNLLETIVQTEAEIAIIDITGVPMVDTLTAQHLLKTVSAARLMGADCIISGIRPQIAQTIVQLGVELNVVSKATLADALALALRRTGRVVSKMKLQSPSAPQEPPAEARG
ncbi:MAG: STAS domain-containing protein [Reyranella sp.]|uniref:STAS domain-containing protein n=1 Tax=Reyranella sp. TaxID=1929291 RepID=UPI00122AA540|nr:STAS domain-containing protein [Reyranella sp.]TAJ97096.1 MAG: STAS domain-containing protein [Reyranella sp.]TBR28452.1 MAG: STAS domain-containing protein [Reyranella sp.]